MIRTFAAETEAVQVRAGDLVAAGTRGRAIDPVETGWTADGTVVALETEFFQLLAKTKFSKQASALEESISEIHAENPDACMGPINTGCGRNTTWH